MKTYIASRPYSNCSMEVSNDRVKSLVKHNMTESILLDAKDASINAFSTASSVLYIYKRSTFSHNCSKEHQEMAFDDHSKHFNSNSNSSKAHSQFPEVPSLKDHKSLRHLTELQ